METYNIMEEKEIHTTNICSAELPHAPTGVRTKDETSIVRTYESQCAIVRIRPVLSSKPSSPSSVPLSAPSFGPRLVSQYRP